MVKLTWRLLLLPVFVTLAGLANGTIVRVLDDLIVLSLSERLENFMLSRSCLPFAFAFYKRCLVRRYSEDVIDLVRGSLHRLGLSGILGSFLSLLLISFYDPEALLFRFIFVKARCHLANLELVLMLLHVLFESKEIRDERRVFKIDLTAQMALGRGG